MTGAHKDDSEERRKGQSKDLKKGRMATRADEINFNTSSHKMKERGQNVKGKVL